MHEKRRILVADDAWYPRDTLRRILEELGHEVLEAKNGLQAIGVFKNEKPGTIDLVMMDVIMPICYGVYALKQILTIEPTARIVVCGIVSWKSKLEEGIQEGARDYLLKPYKSEEVERVLLWVFQ